MALETAALETSPDPVVEGTSDSITLAINSDTEATFDEAAFIADLDAGATTDETAVTETPADGDKVEAKEDRAEDTKPADEATKPTDDPVRAARRILAAANKKERRLADSVAQAETKLIEEFKTNPDRFFDRVGMSFKEWILKAGNVDTGTTAKPEDRVTALEEKLAKKELAEQEAATQRLFDQAHAQIKADATTYPRINRTGSHSMVTDVMVEYYQIHGKPLPLATAANQVEQFLKAASGEPDAPKPLAPKKAPISKDTQANSRPGHATLTNHDTRNHAPTEDGLSFDDEVRTRQVMRELGLL